jgi:HipA-like C-terminal domain
VYDCPVATYNLNQLFSRLRAGMATSAELEHTLGASQSWMSKTLRDLAKEGRVIKIGRTRGARYGLRREIEGIGSAWPLRRVDRAGSIEELGTVYALAADEYYLEADERALARGFTWAGARTGLPYFLQDQRPGGFLGRAVPLRYPEIGLPQRVLDWTDDHYLRYLTLRGSDPVSDLILGRSAFDDFVAQQRHASIVDADKRAECFPEFVDQVMRGALPGSSAAGEHPKFAVLLNDASGQRHVLVKFSPPVDAAAGKRWSDLLIAEHHAHKVLQAAGIAAANSRIFRFEDRTYLEVDRFDREGAHGRVGVTSLLAIDTAFYRNLDNWNAAARRMNNDGRIDARTLERVRLVSTFGALIANTDRHFGNLAFYDNYDGRFELAPVYDMLPMLFAPEHDQIVVRIFDPPDPCSDTLSVWARARVLAENYWRDLVKESSISEEFRKIAGACLQMLEAMPRTGAYAPRGTQPLAGIPSDSKERQMLGHF